METDSNHWVGQENMVVLGAFLFPNLKKHRGQRFQLR